MVPAAPPFLIQGAADGQPRLVQHMGVNHSRGDVLVGVQVALHKFERRKPVFQSQAHFGCCAELRRLRRFSRSTARTFEFRGTGTGRSKPRL
jgi:hypothetical protein